jgi:hypothetical protein
MRRQIALGRMRVILRAVGDGAVNGGRKSLLLGAEELACEALYNLELMLEQTATLNVGVDDDETAAREAAFDD